MVGIFKDRSERLVQILKEQGLEAVLLFPGVNLYYFTGFNIGLSERPSAALIPFEEEPTLIVPRLEEELRGQKPWIKLVKIWEEHEDPFKIIAETISQMRLADATIGLCEEVPWGWINKLEPMLPNVKFVDISDVIYSLRMVKSEWELSNMRKACMIADKAVEAGFQTLEAGLTEMELHATITSEMKSLGGVPQFDIVLFGARAALPHGRPSNAKLKRGDVVLVDTGCTFNGYYSDITRTVVFGKPSERQKRIWNLVLKANRTAFSSIKPGTTCEDADKYARDVISSGDFGRYFIHRLGHGIGLQGHEHPYLVKGNKLPLKSSMTFTIEPGIYIVGELGIRIEDTVVCTEDGCETLTNLGRKITP